VQQRLTSLCEEAKEGIKMPKDGLEGDREEWEGDG